MTEPKKTHPLASRVGRIVSNAMSGLTTIATVLAVLKLLGEIGTSWTVIFFFFLTPFVVIGGIALIAVIFRGIAGFLEDKDAKR